MEKVVGGKAREQATRCSSKMGIALQRDDMKLLGYRAFPLGKLLFWANQSHELQPQADTQFQLSSHQQFTTHAARSNSPASSSTRKRCHHRTCTLSFPIPPLLRSQPIRYPPNALPSSLQAFQSYAQPLINALRSPLSALLRSPTAQQVSNHASQVAQNPSSMTPERILSAIRNVDRRQLVAGGVVFAEVLGFFTVGEMVGRMKLVGYRGDREHHETATPHEGL